MKKYLIAPVVAATLAASGFAVAGGPDNMAAPQPAAAHVVVGVDGGYVWGRPMKVQPYNQGGIVGLGTFVKDSANEGHYAVGGHVAYLYNVMPKFAIGGQLGYLYLGRSNIKATESVGPVSDTYDFKVNEQLVDLLATAQYNVFGHMDVFGQFGPALVMQTNNFSNTFAGASSKKTIVKVEPMIGAGVAYNINNMVVSVAYDHLFGKKPSTTDVTQTATGGTHFANNTYSANMILGSVGYSLPV